MKFTYTAKRILKETFRNPFVMAVVIGIPLIVVFIAAGFFQSSRTTAFKIGVFQVDEGIVQAMTANRANVKVYQDNSDVNGKITADHLDAFLVKNGREIKIVYENSDPNATKETRTLIKSSISEYFSTSMDANIQNARQYQEQAMETGETQYANGVVSPNVMATMNVTYNEGYVYGSDKSNAFEAVSPSLMAMLVAVMGTLSAVWLMTREKQSGMLERCLVFSADRGALGGGYLAGYGVTLILQGVVVTAAVLILCGLTAVGNVGLILLTGALLALSAAALGTAVALWSPSVYGAVGLAAIVGGVQVFFSGIIPVSGMPGALQAIAKIAPSYYASEALRGIMNKGWGPAAAGPDLAALIVFTLVFALLAIVRLKRPQN